MSMFFSALIATATMNAGSAEEMNDMEEVVVYEDAELAKLKKLQELVEDAGVQEISMSDADADSFDSDEEDEE